MNFLFRIHFVSTPDPGDRGESYISLESKKDLRINLTLVTGAILFIAAMFLKANSSDKLMVLPLAFSVFVMISGVWSFSGNGKVVFDKEANKIFCIYKHLGYWQKIYQYNLPSIDAVIEKEENARISLWLEKDDGNKILLSRSPLMEKETIGQSASMIRQFLHLK